MKLKNGEEIEVGEERYIVIDDDLYKINKGRPPMEITVVPQDAPTPLDPNLIDFYLKKGYDVCPSCGLGKEERGGTGCGKYHYGTCCVV